MTVRVEQRHEGSVLMLVPAGVLVLLVLASIAIDSAIVLMADRELSNRTAAAANDIAAAGVDDGTFYGGRGVALGGRQAAAYLRLAFADAHRPAGFRSWDADASASGTTVTVTASAEVDLLFAKALPGVAHTATVSARSVASAVVVEGG